MNSALHSFLAAWPWTTVDVLNHLWQSTVVGVAVLLVLAVGRDLSARTRRTLGWMALVKFALPASLLVHAVARLGATPGRWVEPGALTRPIMLPAFIVTDSTSDAPAPFSAGAVVAAVWLAGAAGLLVSWLVRGRILRRQILAETQPISGAMPQRILAAAERVGLAPTPRCLAVGGERAPGVLGVFRPIVILPRGLETKLAPAELESVLIHEFVHVRRRDNLWGAVQALFVSLLWFHPVVWLLNRRLGLEAEQSCDERVLEITGDPDTYAGGIVKAVQHALGVAQPGLIGATTPPVIVRLKNIFAHGARPDRPVVRGLVLAGGVALLVLSGYTGSFAAQTLSAPTAAPVVAPTPTPTAAPVATRAEPTLSVDFPDEQIRQIISNVANLFELRVVMPDALQGKTTIKLRDVTWRQIFHNVLAPVGYTFVEEGKVVTIVADEQAAATDRAKLDAELAAARSAVVRGGAASPGSRGQGEGRRGAVCGAGRRAGR
jgi:beta-lactamase regulating signal transducer with metallopeptidase domain